MSDTDEHNLDWDDGDLPVSTLFDDTFYSRHDGRAETVHVFLAGNGLPDRWCEVEPEGYTPRCFQIAELGFGTGLNLLETWRQWIATRNPGRHLRFTSFERYPVSVEVMQRAMTPWSDLGELISPLMENWPKLETGASLELDQQTTLQIILGDANKTILDWHEQADAWYLDGFSPAKNPDMWTPSLMAAVAEHTRPEGTFATYTSAGWVRRNLQAAGFQIEKVPGHASKREMLIGRRLPE